jgi:hypothetical protein
MTWHEESEFHTAPGHGAGLQGQADSLGRPRIAFDNITGGTIRLSRGAIGYCYTASGVLFVGFNTTSTLPAVQALRGPEQFHACVQFYIDHIPFLSIA